MMFQEEDRIQEINTKYARFEEELLLKLQKIQKDEKMLKEKYPEEEAKSAGASLAASVPIDCQLAVKRNKQLKQDLDKTKARFRSRITYSPLEKILERAKQDYLREFSVQRP